MKNNNIKEYYDYFRDTCRLKQKTQASTSASTEKEINKILKIKKSDLDKLEDDLYNLDVNF